MRRPACPLVQLPMDKWPYPPEYMEAVYLVRVRPQKEEQAMEIVRKFSTENTAVALSGKDSLVALHLTSRVVSNVNVVISTYAASRRLPQSAVDELMCIATLVSPRAAIYIYDKPWDAHASLFQILRRQFGFRCIITGLRRRENRGHSGAVEYYTWGRLVNPIINWTAGEVWSYIFHHRLPVPSPYRLAARPEAPLQFLLE